ncbi:MAG: Spy/CpxP family protein refolding chaperone [Synechococcales bacterium]|nr:Spy/CpxP family protein refolding chaperone [Synechococcales bacterium]
MNRFLRPNPLERTLHVALAGGLAAIALTAFSVTAQAGPGQGPGNPPMGPGSALEALDLTAEQRTQIQAIREAALDQVADILTPEQRQVAADAIAAGELRGVFRDMDVTVEQRDQIRTVFAGVRDDIAEVLTEEQRAQLREGFQSRWGRPGGPAERFQQR